MTRTANALGWITVTIFAVFLLYLATNGRVTFAPDPLHPRTIMTRHYWFKPNTESEIAWRSGWHYKTAKGEWLPLTVDTLSDTTPPHGPP